MATAQSVPSDPDEAFATLRFALSGGVVFRDRGMTEWSPGPDARLTVDTPYGKGRLRADVAWQAWEGQPAAARVDADGVRSTGDLPNVQTLAVVAGWGWTSDPQSTISLEAGWMLGNLFMLFDLPTGTPGRFESEILTGPWIRVSRQLGPARVFLETRAHRVLTRPRWDALSPSVGLAFEMDTPRWMKWVLQ
ncbi:MAG: hypothetical protein O3C45_01360 [Bacteroidetes bacterium]|nr:hypothetical protein [Bacteroidota bacterium]MDA0873688.1 hypothetical protein [Bacteroidota bacterium]